MLCACKQTKNAPYCDGSHFKVIFRDVVKSVKGVFKWTVFQESVPGDHAAETVKDMKHETVIQLYINLFL